MDVSMQLTKKRQTDKMRGQAEEITEERILDILAGPTSTSNLRLTRHVRVFMRCFVMVFWTRMRLRLKCLLNLISPVCFQLVDRIIILM